MPRNPSPTRLSRWDVLAHVAFGAVAAFILFVCWVGFLLHPAPAVSIAAGF